MAALAALLLLLVATPRAVGAGFAPEDDDDDADDGHDLVQELSIRQYEAVIKGSEVWFIDYFKDDCHACKQIRPILEEFAKEVYAYGIRVGSFDIGQKDGMNIVKQAGLNRVPTLRIYGTPPQANPYTGKMNRIPVDFPFSEGGALDRKMLRDFLKKELKNRVERITAGEWPTVLDEAFAAGKGVVLTLTDRQRTPALLKTLALTFEEDFVFVEVLPEEADFLLAFDVSTGDLAQLFVLPPKEGTTPYLLETLDKAVVEAGHYTGDLTAAPKVKAFIAKHIDHGAKAAAKQRKEAEEEETAATKKGAGGKAGGKGEKKKKDSPPNGAGGLPGPPIMELNETNFKGLVMENKDAWLVWFSPEGSEATDAEWDKYTGKAEGSLRCGVVDCSPGGATAALCAKETGKGKHAFKAYLHGEDKEDENKGFVQVADAYQEAADSVPDVLKRVGDGSNQILIEQEINMAFAAKKFPVVVFTRKPEPALLFRALALKLQPVFAFLFVVDPSEATMARFNGANVPSINVLRPQDMSLYNDNNPNGPPVQHMLQIETYMPAFFGPMKYMSVIHFFIQVLQRVDLARAQQVADLALALPAAEGAGPAAQAVAGGPIIHVDDEASWQNACGNGAASLCVIGLFDGKEDGQAMLQEVSDKETAALAGGMSPWSFSWVDGTCFRAFGDLAFDIQEHALPTVVVYSPKKQRFAAFRGRFGVDGVREFLSGILSGRIPTAPVLTAPRLDQDDVALCYGADGGALAVEMEEEEDMEDLMAEILAEEKKKKEELAAALKRDQEEAKAKAAEEGEAPKKKVVRRKKKKGSDEL